MFRQRAFYHPYKPSPAPLSPAGFRIVDYISPKRCFNVFQGPHFTDIHSPAPSPLSSPLKGRCHPEDDAPPTIRLADFFAGDGIGTPQRPSTPTPDHPRNATPNAKKANALRPDPVPPRRRAQWLKEKHDAARKRILDRHERRVLRARDGISHLRKEAETLMTPEHMDEQDKVFLKQLQALQLDQSLKHDLEQCRQRMSRAAGESTKRRQEYEERDEEAATMWGGGQDEEAREEQKRQVEAFVRAKEDRRYGRHRRMEDAAMRADEERQRAHEAWERKIREEQEYLFRQELARKAKEEEERRRREEEERRRQEARERMLREEVERLRREVHERFLREQRERLAREERQRQASLLAEQVRRAAEEDQLRRHFVTYEAKWNELRTSSTMPPIDVQEVPWPVFGVVSSADQITCQDVQTFLFHPQRPGVEGKTARDKVKSELLCFHPDKFNTRIVPKIQPSQRAVAQEIAGAIVRILTNLMTEEVEQQK